MERKQSQNTLLTQFDPAIEDRIAEPSHEDRNALVREMRRKAKRRKRLDSWMMPLILLGMGGTLFVVNRIDIRLSLTIFAATACIVVGGLLRSRFHWQRMAHAAIDMQDVRAIGPLLSTLTGTDDNASGMIETALIVLLPRVEKLSQLSRQARIDLNRLLMHEEGLPLRSRRAYNARLAYVALRTVARLHDNLSLPAIRRLAEGYGPVRPVASIRDLAHDILPDLEERAALLRPSAPIGPNDQILLRPVSVTDVRTSPQELLRSTEQNQDDVPALLLTRRTTSCEPTDTVEVCSSSVRS